MSKRPYIRTESNRPDYIRKGFYWKVFGHLYTSTISEAFRQRMLKLKEEDEKVWQKKSGE